MATTTAKSTLLKNGPNSTTASDVDRRKGGAAPLSTHAETAPTSQAQPVDAPGVTDEELFEKVRGGCRDSLAKLIKRYEATLFALLVKLTGGDETQADDLFQETFLRAVRAADTYDRSKRFRPWLTTIAVNLTRDEARKRKQRGEISLNGHGEDEKDRDPASARETPLQSAERSDENRKVRQALSRLTEKEREVVLLHFYDSMTLLEVSETLEIPLGTVKSRLHGALTRLKGVLDR